MANLGYVSTFNINGNELTLKDAALTEIVSEIIEAIGANNTNIAERINDLHNRSFDNTIKISSQNESEIASIQDGLYKIQYVTVTGEGDNATETLNNSAILIQDGTNQYLYKDGQISSRTKTNSTWGNWVTFEGGVTSVNGSTGAVVTSLSSNYATSTDTNDDLLLASGDTYEEAFGKLEKAILDNSEVAATAIQEVASNTAAIASNMVTSVNDQTGAITMGESYYKYGVREGDGITVKLYQQSQAGGDIEASTNSFDGVVVGGKFSGSRHSTNTTISYIPLIAADESSIPQLAYLGSLDPYVGVSIKYLKEYVSSNLPSLPPTELSDDYETSTLTNDDLLLASGDTYEEAFGKIEKAILDNELVTSTAVNDLNTRINNLGTLATVATSGDYNDLTNRPASIVNSVNGQTGTVTLTIPDAVTESTVAGWGFTKNVGTLTTETQLSKGTATGTGNAVTDINVSNHQITLVKGATYATQEDINESISNLVNSAPATLDTLNELATALGNDPNFATTVATQIGEKYTKPSTGIPASDLAAGVIPTVPVQSVNGQTGAVSLALGDTNVIETIKVNNTALTPVSKAVNITVPTKVSDLTNDSNFTSNTGTITGITMNGVSKGTSGVVNLGTVLTEHQDISGKVDKITGMGLSSNDYTTTEKNKLAGINIGSLDNLTTAELNSIFTTS